MQGDTGTTGEGGAAPGEMPCVLRSMLFTPGHSTRLAAKALAGQADAVILDLEDACPVSAKAAARALVMEALQQPRNARGYVRINALATPYAHADLMAVVRPGVDGIMLAKTESAADVQTADWVISQLEQERGMPRGCVDLLPLIESARGFESLGAICRASSRVRRLAFGAVDLAAELGIHLTGGEQELLAFRTRLVTVSGAAGIEAPIDLAWIALGDPEGFRSSLRWAKALGFQGKLCIHPDQVAPANEALAPSAEEIEEARRMLAAFAEAERQGIAAIQLGGRMVDYAIARQARRVLQVAARVAAGQPRGEVAGAKGP